MKKIILLMFAISCNTKEDFTNKKVINSSLVTITFDKQAVDKAKLDLLNSFPKSNNDIILLGDSKTEGFPVQEMFNNLKIKNRGIAGNTTSDILERLNHITSGHPKMIFLEIGLNDLSENKDVMTAYNNFSKICSQIKKESPKTQLIIESVLPTAGEKKGLNTKINSYNKLLKVYCIKNNLTFIDINKPFLKGGEMNRKFTYDGIHLTAEGYYKWRELLLCYITK